MYIVKGSNDQNHSSPLPTKLPIPPTWGGHPSIPLKTIWRI